MLLIAKTQLRFYIQLHILNDRSANVYGKMNTATTTASSLDTNPRSNGVTQRTGPTANGSEANGSIDVTEHLRKSFRKKYRHVHAVHSESRPSCLSHDATETPSFLGFRNLMVIVLGNNALLHV